MTKNKELTGVSWQEVRELLLLLLYCKVHEIQNEHITLGLDGDQAL
jgi:hypothetical protein